MVEEIIKTSLLGTDRYQPNLDFGFSETMQKIAAAESNKEARFLMQASAYFMAQSVAFPLKEVNAPEWTVDEDKIYISETAEQIIQSALTEENRHLLNYCFYLFEKNGKIITPFLVPDVLEKYTNESNTQWGKIIPLCGKVGKKILHYFKTETQEQPQNEDIETLEFSQIKKWIIEIRATQPEKIWWTEEKQTSAFEEIFNKEKAEKKVSMLELLQTGVSTYDEAFLTRQLKSKSKNVKQAAIKLLLQINDSKVQHDFLQLLHEVLALKTQKQLLGLKKTQNFLLADEHQLTPEQKAYGLDEISSQKNISDSLHHLYQCIEWMPLSLIAKSFDLTEEETIKKLHSDLKSDYLQQAFVTNAQTYRNTLLITHILKNSNNHRLAEYLPFNDAVEYFKNWMKSPMISNNQTNNYYNNIFTWLFRQEYTEIDADFAHLLLKSLKKNEYCIQGKQYYLLGLYLPERCKLWLEQEQKHPLSEKENGYFQQNIHLILKAIEDKKQLTI